MLTEFCLNTGYNWKYAVRLLNWPPPGTQPEPPARRRRGVTYGQEMLKVLMAVWEAAGYPRSVQLKDLLPLWEPWIRQRYKVRLEIEKQLAISPRQMDRRLKAKKTQQRRRIHGHTKRARFFAETRCTTSSTR